MVRGRSFSRCIRNLMCFGAPSIKPPEMPEAPKPPPPPEPLAIRPRNPRAEGFNPQTNEMRRSGFRGLTIQRNNLNLS